MSKSITDFDTGEIKTETVALFQNLKDGWMPGIAYDTAWMASHSKMFPKSLDWILNNQKDDGSWGCEVEYYHDRLMSTLAAVIALSRSHKADKVRKPVEKGVNFLWKGLDEIKRKNTTPSVLNFCCQPSWKRRKSYISMFQLLKRHTLKKLKRPSLT